MVVNQLMGVGDVSLDSLNGPDMISVPLGRGEGVRAVGVGATIRCQTAFKALLALEEGTGSHGMQVAPRGWESLGNRLSSRALEEASPADGLSLAQRDPRPP